jgi:hypothetical protein
MQLMCNYTTYVLWKYKAIKKIKYHIWNLWSSIIIVYIVGIGSIFLNDIYLWIAQKLLKNNYGATNMQLGFNA